MGNKDIQVLWFCLVVFSFTLNITSENKFKLQQERQVKWPKQEERKSALYKNRMRPQRRLLRQFLKLPSGKTFIKTDKYSFLEAEGG